MGTGPTIGRIVADDAAVELSPSSDGFTIDLPSRVDIPDITRRFEDQELRADLNPERKVALLAWIQGWGVETLGG